MMASPLAVRFTCLALMCMVFSLPLSEAALTCSQVQNSAIPCISYLATGGSSVPAACCDGIRSLNRTAITTPDRQTVCRCIVSSLKSVPTVNPSVLSSLPAKCGVKLPYQISPTIDCSKVR